MGGPVAARNWSYRTIEWTRFLPPSGIAYVVQSKLSRRLTTWQKNLRLERGEGHYKAKQFS